MFLVIKLICVKHTLYIHYISLTKLIKKNKEKAFFIYKINKIKLNNYIKTY